jgi:hypothetical protein
MTVLFMLLTFGFFLTIDYIRKVKAQRALCGTQYTTPGFEMLGALAQDGGELVKLDEKK